MSWLDRIQSNLTITTGEGSTFTPLWKPARKSVDYNVTEFEFAEVEGTLVHRTQVKGTRYEVDIYFTGEDCIDDALAFEVAARDPRRWTISHPYHGRIYVQPIGLNFDYTKYNSVSVTGSVVETITNENPTTTVVPEDKILNDKIVLDETTEETFATNVQEPTTEDINKLTANNLLFYTEGKKIIKLTEEAEVYFNLFNDANAKILNATAEPLLAIRALQAVIAQPYLFTVSVTNRLDMLQTQFNRLREDIANISTPAGKRIFENNAGAIVAAMCASASTPQDGDYGNRGDVLAAIDPIAAVYDQFVSDLDTLQTDNGGDVDSYIPDPAALLGLSSLVNYTLANLFDIALESRQERSIYLEKDSNVILLTHRFYGLDADDANLEEFIRNNNIGLNELLQIRKGRKIIYYV